MQDGHTHQDGRHDGTGAAASSAGGSGRSTDRLARLLRLLSYVQANETPGATQIAAHLNISRRTLFRDLKILEAAGVPLVNVPGRGYRLDPDYVMTQLTLSAPEALGLMLLDKVSERLPDQPLLQPAHQAIKRIIAELPSAQSGIYRSLLEQVSFEPGSINIAGQDDDLFRDLQMAIEDGRVCKVRYRSTPPQEPLVGRLHPLHLHFWKHSWYLFAFSEEHGEVRMFKLSRFESLQRTDEPYPPIEFDREEFLDDAWGIIPGGTKHDVAIHFSNRVARNVAQIRWHRTQCVEPQDDGSIIVRFHVNGLDEIKWWILGYGAEAEVLEPSALRDELQQMAQDLLDVYAGKGADQALSSTTVRTGADDTIAD